MPVDGIPPARLEIRGKVRGESFLNGRRDEVPRGLGTADRRIEESLGAGEESLGEPVGTVGGKMDRFDSSGTAEYGAD